MTDKKINNVDYVTVRQKQNEEFQNTSQQLMRFYQWKYIPLALKFLIPLIIVTNILQLCDVTSYSWFDMDPRKIIQQKKLRRLFIWFLGVKNLKDFSLNLILLVFMIPLYRRIQEAYSSIYVFSRVIAIHFILSKVNCLIWWIWNMFGPHSYEISGIMPIFVYLLLVYSTIQPETEIVEFHFFPMKMTKWHRGLLLSLILIVISWQITACLQVLLSFSCRNCCKSCYKSKPNCCHLKIQQCFTKIIGERSDFIIWKQKQSQITTIQDLKQMNQLIFQDRIQKQTVENS